MRYEFFRVDRIDGFHEVIASNGKTFHPAQFLRVAKVFKDL
jgi:hypothetical protein